MRVLKGFGWTLLVIGQLWLSSVVYGGGGSVEDMPQQQMGKIVVNVDTPPSDNTAIYVGAAATVTAAGLGYLGVRQARKKD